MIRKFKIILTSLFLCVFAAQSVLACICDFEINDQISSHAHHHDMATHGQHMSHHDTDHDCESDCRLSFKEQDGTDLVFSIHVIDKNDDVLQASHDYLSLIDARPVIDAELKLIESSKLPPPTTLYSESILLLI